MKELTINDVENSASYTFYNQKVLGSLMHQFEGWEYPSPIVVIEDIASKGGAAAVASKFGRRICSFVPHFTCDILTERVALLTTLRQTGNLKLIEFTTLNDIDLQFYAYINKFTAPYTSMMKPMLIEFAAPDYRFYSQTETTIDVAANDIETINNAGNDLTEPVFTVTGPSTVVTIDNLTTGEQIVLDDAITGGSTLEIDIVNKTVKYNGVEAFSRFSGDFFGLQPGDNLIQFTATGSSGATELEVVYRDAYNGV